MMCQLPPVDLLCNLIKYDEKFKACKHFGKALCYLNFVEILSSNENETGCKNAINVSPYGLFGNIKTV